MGGASKECAGLAVRAPVQLPNVGPHRPTLAGCARQRALRNEKGICLRTQRAGGSIAPRRVREHRFTALLIPEAGTTEPPSQAGAVTFGSLLLDQTRGRYTTPDSSVQVLDCPLSNKI